MKTSHLLLLSMLAFGCSTATSSTNPSTPTLATTPTASASTSTEAPANLAEIEAAIQANDGAKARKLAEDLLVHSPKNPKAHYYAGVGAEATGDKQAAEEHYRKAIELGFSEAAINLSALLLDMGKAADAVALLKPLAAKAPEDLMLQTNFAVALSVANDHVQSAQIYDSLLKTKSTPELRLGYVGELLALGKKEDAVRVLEEGVAQAGNQPELYAIFGKELAKIGDYEGAIKAMDKAIQLKSNPEFLTYRALFKRSLKKNTEAQADLEAAIKANPTFAAAHFYLGELFEAMKKPADARKFYEKAAELEPESSRGKMARERADALKKK